MGSATAVEYEIEAVLESQDTGVCWRLRFIDAYIIVIFRLHH